MPTFSYKAIDESGNSLTGTIEADTLDMATNMLNERGYIPSKVVRQIGAKPGLDVSGIRERLFRIKAQEIILFSKQFRTMLRAGVPILNILRVLERQSENERIRKICASMAEDIKGGASLYEAFQKHPHVFSTMYCSMIRTGEISGSLPEVMDRLIYILEHERKVKSDIKSALQYPVIVVIFLALAFIFLLTFVIPKFVQVFKSAGIELPLPTKICLFMYHFLFDYWPFLLGGGIAGFLALVYYFRTNQGKILRDSLLMRIPLVGPLLIKAAMSRFASIFSILQSSGITVLNSMDVLSGTIGNAAISRQFDRIKERIEEGKGISGPLESAKHFTPMVINMVAIGEESGRLDEMLGEIASHYDDEVEYSTARLGDAIGPVLIVSLAAVVGFFALAIFLPMWDLTKMVK